MVKIKCRAIDCIFWDEGHCSSDEITYDPDEGCLTYEIMEDLLDDDSWDDDEDLDDLIDDSDDEIYDYGDDGDEEDEEDEDW